MNYKIQYQVGKRIFRVQYFLQDWNHAQNFLEAKGYNYTRKEFRKGRRIAKIIAHNGIPF